MPPEAAPEVPDVGPWGEGAQDAHSAGPRAPRILRALLRVPLFYKILLANAAIMILGAIGGTAITREYLRAGEAGVSTPAFVGVLALIGVLVTVLVNALILRLALMPLKQLEQTAARVHAGDLVARVPPSVLTDRELERLTSTFNAMLDNLEVYRQRLRDVAARALHAEEEERKRIARELHDDTAQTLAALLIRLRLLRATETPELRDRLVEEFRVELGEALEGIRRFAHGLRPPALDELGLVPALEAHVRGLSESVGISIRMEAKPLEGALTPQVELALYRIVQEALSNAVRHANAQQIEVDLTARRGWIEALVRDDGHGFAVDEIMQGEARGLGLFGMQERAAYVGGRVEVRSRPGAGTEVRAEIPVAGSISH